MRDEVEEVEYEDSIAGRFEKMVDDVTEIRRSIFEGVCDQIKNVAGSISGRGEEDEESEPGPLARIVDTVNGVDQAIVEGTADVIKSVGRTILGIF